VRPLTVLRLTLALNVFVTIGAMLLAYRTLRHADDSERLVLRSHQVLKASEETLRRAVDAETGTRGFIISRNDVDLAPYDRALQTIRRSMDDLATFLREDGREEHASRLQTQIDGTLTILGQMVERIRAGETVEAPMHEAANASMAALRDTIRAIHQAETDVLDARMRADDAAGIRVKRLAIATTGLATALLTLMLGLLVFVVRPGAWRG